MPNPTPIHSILFLDLAFQNREAFLGFVKKNVVEFAFAKQELFNAMGFDVSIFHKDKQRSRENQSKVLIHTLQENSFLLIRAYTKQGIDSLLFWYELFKKKYPHYCKNTVQSTESFQYEALSKPQVYISNNWIPFRDCRFEKNDYYNNETGEKIDNYTLEKRIKGNLLTFINNLDLPTSRYTLDVNLFEVLPKHKTQLALITKENNSLIHVKKHTFKVLFSVNVQLPYLFSLGQNVSYGNGVFQRKNTKIAKNEKNNLKPSKTTQ